MDSRRGRYGHTVVGSIRGLPLLGCGGRPSRARRCESETVLTGHVVPDDDSRAAPVTVAAAPRRGRRLLRCGLCVALTAVVLIAAHRPILRAFALGFRVSDPARSDALVLLLGGDADRARKAAELFQQGYAPLILIGSDPDTEMNRQALLTAGVPEGAIRVLGPVHDTHDEALQVREFVHAHPVVRITLVTTSYHTARSRWVFGRALRDRGVEVHTAASRSEEYDEANWYRTSRGRSTYARELAKFAYYRLNY